MKKSGQIIVEFAIIVSIFLVIVLGSVDYAFYMYARYNLEGAVRNALRYAVREKDWTNPTANKAEAISRVKSYCYNISPTLYEDIDDYVIVDVTYLGPLIDYITIEVKDYPYTPVVGFAEVFVPKNLSTKAVMRF